MSSTLEYKSRSVGSYRDRVTTKSHSLNRSTIAMPWESFKT